MFISLGKNKLKAGVTLGKCTFLKTPMPRLRLRGKRHVRTRLRTNRCARPPAPCKYSHILRGFSNLDGILGVFFFFWLPCGDTMRCLSPVTVCCVALLLLEPRLLAAPVGSPLQSTRLNFLKSQTEVEETGTLKPGTVSRTQLTPDVTLEAKRALWRSLLIRGPPPRHARAAPLRGEGTLHQRLRAARYAHTGSRAHQHHAQLMRVGCVLGTCQVQNLSHRLYQLMGQSGREDSSPMNPRSPHSYG
ncbi:ADM2-like [Arapaima gigas]